MFSTNRFGCGAGRLILLVALLFTVFASKRFLVRVDTVSEKLEAGLYLPAAPALALFSLGNEGLMSDLVLARALTYTGAHMTDREFPFRHQKDLFFTAVQLDPRNSDAVILASNILAGRSVDDAIEILKLGMKQEPLNWKYPELIAFRYFFNQKNFLAAARFYELAARLPGHPPYVPSLSAKMYEESGRLDLAVQVLTAVCNTTADKRLKRDFENMIGNLKKKLQEERRKKDVKAPAIPKTKQYGESHEYHSRTGYT